MVSASEFAYLSTCIVGKIRVWKELYVQIHSIDKTVSTQKTYFFWRNEPRGTFFWMAVKQHNTVSHMTMTNVVCLDYIHTTHIYAILNTLLQQSQSNYLYDL